LSGSVGKSSAKSVDQLAVAFIKTVWSPLFHAIAVGERGGVSLRELLMARA